MTHMTRSTLLSTMAISFLSAWQYTIKGRGKMEKTQKHLDLIVFKTRLGRISLRQCRRRLWESKQEDEEHGGWPDAFVTNTQ